MTCATWLVRRPASPVASNGSSARRGPREDASAHALRYRYAYTEPLATSSRAQTTARTGDYESRILPAMSAPPANARRVSQKGAAGVGAGAQPRNVLASVWSAYQQATPPRHKIIDAFLIFNMVAGILIFAHGMLVTTFPFDSWIAAFASTAGQFVLTAALRIQTTPANASDFPKVTQSRAFADFLFGSIILHFFVINYLQ
ncbi:unnamed protein product [Parajaminaea phylloscopi]